MGYDDEELNSTELKVGSKILEEMKEQIMRNGFYKAVLEIKNNKFTGLNDIELELVERKSKSIFK